MFLVEVHHSRVKRSAAETNRLLAIEWHGAHARAGRALARGQRRGARGPHSGPLHLRRARSPPSARPEVVPRGSRIEEIIRRAVDQAAALPVRRQGRSVLRPPLTLREESSASASATAGMNLDYHRPENVLVETAPSSGTPTARPPGLNGPWHPNRHVTAAGSGASCTQRR